MTNVLFTTHQTIWEFISFQYFLFECHPEKLINFFPFSEWGWILTFLLKERRILFIYQKKTLKECTTTNPSICWVFFQEKDEDRPPQVLYRCGEEYFMHQVSSTTSPPYQIPLIGTPPELPRPISEGSAEGGSQTYISTSSSCSQQEATSPKLSEKVPSPPPPMVPQQVIVSFWQWYQPLIDVRLKFGYKLNQRVPKHCYIEEQWI